MTTHLPAADAGPLPDASRTPQQMDIVLRPRPFVPSEIQFQVLTARAAGGSRKEAAAILGWTKGKVDYHLRKLLFGAHLHDDAQAIFVFRDEIAARMKHP